MDCISNDQIREVVVKKSARVGYTKMLLAALGYFAEHKRRNQCVWQPTDDDAEDFVKTDVDTMLRDVGVMERVFPVSRQRDSDNTLNSKRFLGSVLHIRGGKAAKNYRRLTVDVAYLDELDGFDSDIQGEGSPVILSRKRLEGATYPKHIIGSSPGLKDLSMIEERALQAQMRMQWHTPCPECGSEHAVAWGGKDKAFGMKWGPGQTAEEVAKTVRQLCPECGALYSQQDYLRVWGTGRWIDRAGNWIDPDGDIRSHDDAIIAPPRSIAFDLWTAQSKQAQWSDIVAEFLAAVDKAREGNKTLLKTFTNTTLGETWEEEVQKADADVLRQRAEDYPLRECPRGVLLLTAGVDVQDRRFEVDVWGWGRGEESWLIDHMVIECNPADSRDWDRLDDYLKTRFAHASGQTLPIEAVGIDTGGHFTHEVYNFCRVRTARRIYAVKGSEKQGQPIKGRSTLQDVNYRGAVLKGGVRMHYVGTDTAKDLIFGRIEIERPGPGYVHLCKHVPDDWFDQFTAEARVPQKVAGGQVWRWVAIKKRNEALDTCVYATFAAHMMDLPRYTDSMWSRIEDRLYPMQGDLLAGTPPASAEAVAESDAEPGQRSELRDIAPRMPPKRAKKQIKPARNFVTNWGRLG